MFGNFLTSEGDRAVFGDDPPIPTREEVDSIILIAEERIEDHCRTAFGTRTLQFENELHDVLFDYWEMAFHLNYPKVTTLSTGDGDKLEVWQNNAWVDYLALGYSEGRNGDYFVDYDLGKIFFIKRKPRSGRMRVRVTYRVNFSATVPENIKYATALKTAQIIAGNPSYTVYFPEGEEKQSIKSRLDFWEKELISAISAYRIGVVPVGSSFQQTRFG